MKKLLIVAVIVVALLPANADSHPSTSCADIESLFWGVLPDEFVTYACSIIDSATPVEFVHPDSPETEEQPEPLTSATSLTDDERTYLIKLWLIWLSAATN